MKASPVAQYLARYAAPEARWAERLDERHHAALVVPAFRESPTFLERYEAALAAAPGRVLVIVVVNARAGSAESHRFEHERLLEALRGAESERLSEEPPAWLARRARYDVLAIDRATPPFCFGDTEGVGLARRIGCDVALALYARGALATPWFYCTDADAELAPAYFLRDDGVARGVSARVFGFWHVPGGGDAIDRATELYEVGLRYYVLSLASAGSPFAYHALGSALAVHAEAYAAVRGFPRRQAGEDFYLLNKLCKVGPLQREPEPVVRLESRASERTAFGTGAAARRIASTGSGLGSVLYAPGVFRLLAAWLSVLGPFAREPDARRLHADLRERAGADYPRLASALERIGAPVALERAARETHSARARRRHLHTWFDAFQTLKLIHALRDGGVPSLPWREALAHSELGVRAQASTGPLDAIRRALLDGEQELSSLVGPTLD